MKISAKDIQKLREKTSAGVMDCKKALSEAEGDFTKATRFLRDKGIATAQKKASRVANQGRIEAYVHMHNRIGVLVELNCETDFVAKCEDFITLSRDIAMQIAALNPQYVKKEDVPKEVLEENKENIDDFYKINCLLEQSFVKDQSKSIKDCITEAIAKIGENIVLGRFIRFQLGE